MEVLEQAVEHFQGQQGENALEFEARLEGMFQKFDNKIASHAQTSVREAVRVRRHGESLLPIPTKYLKSCLFCLYLLETGFISVQ